MDDMFRTNKKPPDPSRPEWLKGAGRDFGTLSTPRNDNDPFGRAGRMTTKITIPAKGQIVKTY
jgi:hypothetical protein